MLNYQETRKLVDEDLREIGYDESVKIYDEFSIELESGWVFFYNSIDTSNGNSLVGNAPYIVNKLTGKFHLTGTGEPIEYYIDDYEEELNGHKNIWTIRLKNKPGITKFYKAYKLSKQTYFYFNEIWAMLNSYPKIFKEGEIRKILPIKYQFERVGTETIMEKKEHSS